MRRKPLILIASLILVLLVVVGIFIWVSGREGKPEFLSGAAPAYESLLRATKLLPSSTPSASEPASEGGIDATALENVRRALMERFEAPEAAYHSANMNGVLSEVGTFKQIALALKNEGARYEAENKLEEAARVYVDIVRLGIKVESGPLIFAMIGQGIERIGMEALDALEPGLPSPARHEVAAALRRANSHRIPFNAIEERERYFRRNNSPTPFHMIFFSRRLRATVEQAKAKYETTWQAVDALASKLDRPARNIQSPTAIAKAE